MKLPFSQFEIHFQDLPASAWSLIAANTLPIFGVLLLGWSVFELVFVYWIENVILGGINLLKMYACRPDFDSGDNVDEVPTDEAKSNNKKQAESKKKTRTLQHQESKRFLMPFFTVHYSGFCLGHGIFVLTILGDNGILSSEPLSNFDQDISPWAFPGIAIRVIFEKHLWWVILGLLASHLYSFFSDYIGKGEFRQTTASELMHQPYGRIVVLHVALLFGGIIVALLGSPVLLLLILIVGKTSNELKSHLNENRESDHG